MSSPMLPIWTTVSAKLDASLSNRHVMRPNPSFPLTLMNTRDEILPGDDGPIGLRSRLPFSPKVSWRFRCELPKTAISCVTFRTGGKFFKMGSVFVGKFVFWVAQNYGHSPSGTVRSGCLFTPAPAIAACAKILTL